MVKIPNAKISKSGDLYYVAIPIDFIKSDILSRNVKYNIEILPMKAEVEVKKEEEVPA